MLKFSAWLASVTGPLLVVYLTFHYWNDWQAASMIGVIGDYSAATMTFLGGVLTLCNVGWGRPLPAGGWGLTAGMAYVVYVRSATDAAPAMQAFLFRAEVQILLVVSVVGLLTAIIGVARSPEGQAHSPD